MRLRKIFLTLSVFLLTVAFLGLATQAKVKETRISGIIKEDTVLTKANSPYRLTSKLQVAKGVTLTIEPGVTIESSGQFIELFGSLKAIGTKKEPITLSRVSIVDNMKANADSIMDLEHLNMKGWAKLSNSRVDHFTLKNSTLQNIDIWLRNHEATEQYKGVVEGNTLLNNDFFNVTLSKGILNIQHNLFHHSKLEIWSLPNAKPIVIGNSFILNKEKMINIESDYGEYMDIIDLSNNYWGSTSKEKIESYIHDANSDLNRTITAMTTPVLTNQSELAPVYTKETPILEGIKSKTIKKNKSFYPTKGITAKAATGEDLTNDIKITGKVNTKRIGKYKLTYFVQDKFENKIRKSCTIKVK